MATPAAARQAALFLLNPALLAAGLLAYALVRLLEPWRRIQFGLIRFDRIGHLSVNTETFLRARARGIEDPATLCLFVSARPANRQILDLIKRKLWVFESLPLRWLFNYGIKPRIVGTRFEQLLPFGSNEYANFGNAPSQLLSAWRPDELERGQRLLDSLGIPAGTPFVCFHARDKAYLDATLTHSTRAQKSYHDYRDCDIDNYLPAAQWLTEQGFYCLRMGAAVEKPITSKSPRIIDYALKHRSDFGDAFLLSHCRFYLGNTAGTSSVASSFDVPVAEANLAPLAYPPYRAVDLFLPKKYREARTGRGVAFAEIVAAGLYDCQNGHDFDSAGFEVTENTGPEILALAQEMLGRLEGTWRADPRDEALQRRYWALFPLGSINSGCPARVGAQFLRENEALLPKSPL